MSLDKLTPVTRWNQVDRSELERLARRVEALERLAVSGNTEMLRGSFGVVVAPNAPVLPVEFEARITDGPDSANSYGWVRRIEKTPGAWVDDPTLQSTATTRAIETDGGLDANGIASDKGTSAGIGSAVRMRVDATTGGYIFSAPGPKLVTLNTQTGKTVAFFRGVITIEIDQVSGLTAATDVITRPTQPIVSLVPATGTQAGGVSLLPQTMGNGAKTFQGTVFAPLFVAPAVPGFGGSILGPGGGGVNTSTPHATWDVNGTLQVDCPGTPQSFASFSVAPDGTLGIGAFVGGTGFPPVGGSAGNLYVQAAAGAQGSTSPYPLLSWSGAIVATSGYYGQGTGYVIQAGSPQQVGGTGPYIGLNAGIAVKNDDGSHTFLVFMQGLLVQTLSY